MSSFFATSIASTVSDSGVISSCGNINARHFFLPNARVHKNATTAESIPPLRPNITPEEFVSDIFVRIKLQIFSTICSY